MLSLRCATANPSARLRRAVLVPGYGAGAAFYFRNLADLSARFRTYAVDVLGTGLSGLRHQVNLLC